jgi:hypothetical protein
LQDNDGGRFQIDSVTGIVTVAGAIDREADGASRTITVRATSSDGSFTDQNFTIAINDLDEFDVGTLIDVNNSPNIVPEHSASGTVVGITVLASDADATTNSVTYQLLDNAQGRFAIDAITGIITVADSSLLRYELGPNYSVTVRADSTDGSFDTAAFALTLDNLNDTPFAIGDTFSLNENGSQNLNVLNNDYDLDPGDTLQIVSANITSGLGNIIFTANSISYNPGTNYDYLSVGESAIVEFIYTISDTGGLQSTAIATLTIQGDRDPLVLDAPAIYASEDNRFVWTISVIPIDTNGEMLTSVIVSGLPEGTIISDTHGQKVEVVLGTATELIDLDIQQLEIVLPIHVSGNFSIVIETRSDLGSSSLQSIVRNWSIEAIADAPNVSAQSARGSLGEVIPLQFGSQLVDRDGSELLKLEIRGLPVNTTLTDGNFQLTITDSRAWVDISNWESSRIVLKTAQGLSGNYVLELRASAIESANQDFAQSLTTLDVVIDQVLPISELDNNIEASKESSFESRVISAPEKNIALHSAHNGLGAHFQSITPDITSAAPKSRHLFTTDEDGETLNRSDSYEPTSIPVPNFVRARGVTIEAHLFEHTATAKYVLSDEEASEYRNAVTRVAETMEHLYTPVEKLTVFQSANHTLFLAWTMIRSSIANMMGQGENSQNEERRQLADTYPKEERRNKDTLPVGKRPPL